ncbi:MAG: hypothetical protein NC084_11960 [Bacteroides sp.]|nr:hypothetical protein [Eubacterium sp.]MCM1419305.1 hypothetical protein [Roseburia sp.]MCM1463407.1 hypothetical protein [Bacteroides sp.]
MDIKVKLGGKEYPLYCSTEAYSLLGELSGGNIEHLDELFGVKKPQGEAIGNIAAVLTILINGEIKRRNLAIDLGIEEGNKRKLIEIEQIAGVAPPKELIASKAAIFNAIADALVYEIPDEVKLARREIDEDLEEIRDNEAKKAGGAG